MLLSSIDMKRYAKNVSSGSIHKGIRHGDLYDFSFSCPNPKLLRNFEEIALPILKEIDAFFSSESMDFRY